MVLLTVVAVLGAGCGHGASGPAPGVVVAHVNGQPVYKSEVDEVAGFSKLTRNPLSFDKALDVVVGRHLLEAEAAKLGISVTDADVQARLDQVMAGMGGQANLEASLSGEGLKLDDYKAELRASILAERVAAEQFKGTVATRGEALAVYRKHHDEILKPATVRLQEIVAKTQQLGVWLVAQVKKGQSFGALARRYSTDPQAKSRGGLLGWIQVSSLPAPLAQAVAKLKPGQVSAPTQAVGGWHVLKLLGARPQRQLTFAEVRQRIEDKLTLDKRTALLKAWLAKLRKTAQVTIGQ